MSDYITTHVACLCSDEQRRGVPGAGHAEAALGARGRGRSRHPVPARRPPAQIRGPRSGQSANLINIVTVTQPQICRPSMTRTRWRCRPRPRPRPGTRTPPTAVRARGGRGARGAQLRTRGIVIINCARSRQFSRG